MKELENKNVSLKKGIIWLSIIVLLEIITVVVTLLVFPDIMTLFLTLECIASIFIIGGFFSNQPNKAKVLTPFDKYVRICKIPCLN